ncbi:MAG TPA: TetR/AcrR family transcriptional regulator [Myxococcota bacterium]
MTTTKDAYHHGDLRNALVEAAIALVKDVGAEQFSLRDAARTVGVSANATYRHFDSKSALLTAVAAAGLAKMAARMQRRLAPLDTPRGVDDRDVAVERFKVVARAYVDFGVDNAELFRVMFGPSGICKMLVTAEPGGPRLPRDVLDGVLDDLVVVGLLPTHKRAGAVLAVWTMLHGFTSLATQVGEGFAVGAQRKAALEALLGFTLDGLMADSEGGPPLAPPGC